MAQNDQSDVYAGAKGGVVQRMAKGGVVKAFDLGGPTDDESEDAQFDNEANSADYEDARAGGNTGNPELAGMAPPQGTPPALIQPPQGAIPRRHRTSRPLHKALKLRPATHT